MRKIVPCLLALLLLAACGGADSSEKSAGVMSSFTTTDLYGEDVDEQSADELCRTLADRYGDCDVELQFGGQPIYYYIVSCE